jgi:hypothetical protein
VNSVKKILRKYPELTMTIWENANAGMYQAAITHSRTGDNLLIGCESTMTGSMIHLNSLVHIRLICDKDDGLDTFMGLEYKIIRDDEFTASVDDDFESELPQEVRILQADGTYSNIEITDSESDTMDEMYTKDGEFMGLIGNVDEFIMFIIQNLGGKVQNDD